MTFLSVVPTGEFYKLDEFEVLKKSESELLRMAIRGDFPLSIWFEKITLFDGREYSGWATLPKENLECLKLRIAWKDDNYPFRFPVLIAEDGSELYTKNALFQPSPSGEGIQPSPPGAKGEWCIYVTDILLRGDDLKRAGVVALSPNEKESGPEALAVVNGSATDTTGLKVRKVSTPGTHSLTIDPDARHGLKLQILISCPVNDELLTGQDAIAKAMGYAGREGIRDCLLQPPEDPGEEREEPFPDDPFPAVEIAGRYYARKSILLVWAEAHGKINKKTKSL